MVDKIMCMPQITSGETEECFKKMTESNERLCRRGHKCVGTWRDISVCFSFCLHMYLCSFRFLRNTSAQQEWCKSCAEYLKKKKKAIWIVSTNEDTIVRASVFQDTFRSIK